MELRIFFFCERKETTEKENEKRRKKKEDGCWLLVVNAIRQRLFSPQHHFRERRVLISLFLSLPAQDCISSLLPILPEPLSIVFQDRCDLCKFVCEKNEKNQ